MPTEAVQSCEPNASSYSSKNQYMPFRINRRLTGVRLSICGHALQYCSFFLFVLPAHAFASRSYCKRKVSACGTGLRDFQNRSSWRKWCESQLPKSERHRSMQSVSESKDCAGDGFFCAKIFSASRWKFFFRVPFAHEVQNEGPPEQLKQ